LGTFIIDSRVLQVQITSFPFQPMQHNEFYVSTCMCMYEHSCFSNNKSKHHRRNKHATILTYMHSASTHLAQHQPSILQSSIRSSTGALRPTTYPLEPLKIATAVTSESLALLPSALCARGSLLSDDGVSGSSYSQNPSYRVHGNNDVDCKSVKELI
jgi:hypothetical protein